MGIGLCSRVERWLASESDARTGGASEESRSRVRREAHGPTVKQTRVGPHGQYTDEVRLTVAGLMAGYISAKKACWVIEWVAKSLFNVRLSHTPSPRTCLSFVSECSVASSAQITQFISGAETLTLGHDETTKHQRKLQLYMLYGADAERAPLGVFHVPDKSAKTSLETFLWGLQRILHQGFCLLPTLRLKCPDVLKKIKSTISDQASTEKSFNNLLEKIRQDIPGLEQDELNRFYCFMHLIAGWASEGQAALEKVQLSHNQTACE